MGFNPDKAIHPGYTLAKVLERIGMSQKNLGERTGLSEKHISQIINNEASITVDTALLFENAIGGSAAFWINVEKNYQETKARIEKIQNLRNETALLKDYPYKELVKYGFIEAEKNHEKRVENLWKFFGVNSLSYIQHTEAVAYRKKDGVNVKQGYIAAWLRCGELEFKKNKVSEFNESNLRSNLSVIRGLTLNCTSNTPDQVSEVLAKSGVSFVVFPHFSGTGVSGAVRWIGNNPVIQLTLFGSRIDMFWFNLFHEIGHILLHGKKDKFIEFDNRDLSSMVEKEKEADMFASNELIPPKEYSKFLNSSDLSSKSIKDFAKDIGVDASIVAGRLCHDKYLDWKAADHFRPRLKFATR